MDLQDFYLEEDLFPALFTKHEERSYGILYYNTENRDSFDSNHAVIYKDKIDDLQQVLVDIREFYSSKGCQPMIYQSAADDGWFEEIKDELLWAGYSSWSETQEYMVPAEENRITPNPDIEVIRVERWSHDLENIFLEAEETWETEVAKRLLENPTTWMFAALYAGKMVGITYGHISTRACRGDYLLVSKKHRGIGAGRALFNTYVNWCKQNGIVNAYLWPDGDSPKRIYEEGGYRVAELRKAGRAIFENR